MSNHRNSSSSINPNSRCDSCPQYTRSTSGTSINNDNASVYVETLKSCLNDIQRLESRVNTLEQNDAMRANFYNESSKLSRTSRIAVIALMVVPVLQLLVCAVIVYYLGLEEKLPNILKWFIGGVSALSVFEMIVTIIKAYNDTQKFERIEKEIDNLKKSE